MELVNIIKRKDRHTFTKMPEKTIEALKYIYQRLRHCVIFPKGPPFSIFTAVTFHYRVRNGSMWVHYAIKHLSQ